MCDLIVPTLNAGGNMNVLVEVLNLLHNFGAAEYFSAVFRGIYNYIYSVSPLVFGVDCACLTAYLCFALA